MIAQTDITSLTLPLTIGVAAAASLMGAAFAFGANYFMMRRAVKDIEDIARAAQKNAEQLIRHDERIRLHEQRIRDVERAQEQCPKC